jgi:hypothetical protein
MRRGVHPQTIVSDARNKRDVHNVVVHDRLRPSLEVVEHVCLLLKRLACFVKRHHGVNGVVANVRKKRTFIECLN